VRLLALAALLPLAAQAGPFLVSDPYPASGAQPDSCSYQEGTAAAVVVPVAKDAAGLPYCRFDLAGVTRAAHSYQVRALNAWGQSDPVPFAFSAAGPGAATGLRVIP
jgi:hypothetical protein